MDVHLDPAGDMALVLGIEDLEVVLGDVVDAAEAVAAVDRPGERRDGDLQLLFQLIEEVKGVLRLAVHLIDKDDHRGLPQAADLHQFLRLRLHAARPVDHDDDRVDGGEGAEGILSEVLVSRGVEDIDLIVLVLKAHYGGGDGDAALLLDLHPVGGGGAADLIALDRPGDVDRPSEEEELLGEGGLTGIGVSDDGKGASAGYLFCKVFHLSLCVAVDDLLERLFPGAEQVRVILLDLLGGERAVVRSRGR